MPQQVVLLADVPGLGQLGDVCKVKDGYFRNYLIPQHKAVIATPNVLKKFEKQKEKLAQEREKHLTRAKTLSEKVAKVGLVFERPVGQGGRLFGSVTALDIAGAFATEGATVEKKSILMNGPIKTAGDHTIRVRIHSQVIVDVPVKVVGLEVKKNENQEPEEEIVYAKVPDDY